ncbi:MAG: Hsp33 family molecular chaperone HslO [Ghiorsea sp.]
MQIDTLIRFLLPDAHARGAIIRGTHMIDEAVEVHGLQDKAAELFGQTLLASVMLLSISKGGVRQVLQLDASGEQTPIRRMQAECKAGAVRGYVQWQEEAVPTLDGHEGISAFMGEHILLSTVRDLGVGQPYVSTVQHNSDWLAEHMLEYLRQSVQVQADMILQGDLAIMIEAMPGCDDEHWFKAVETMAKISNAMLQDEKPEKILEAFDDLGCQVVGQDSYSYACSCSKETMTQALDSLTDEDLKDLADEAGDVVLSCQYCKNHVKVNIAKKGIEK